MGNQENSVDAILAERQKTHGDYTVHSGITYMLKQVMRSQSSFPRLTPDMQETLDMTAHKIGRILAGNPNEPDHWDDISGYAKLTADRCRLRAAAKERETPENNAVEAPKKRSTPYSRKSPEEAYAARSASQRRRWARFRAQRKASADAKPS